MVIFIQTCKNFIARVKSHKFVRKMEKENRQFKGLECPTSRYYWDDMMPPWIPEEEVLRLFEQARPKLLIEEQKSKIIIFGTGGCFKKGSNSFADMFKDDI